MKETEIEKDFYSKIINSVDEELDTGNAATSTQAFSDIALQYLVISGKVNDYNIENFGSNEISGFSIDEGDSISIFVIDYYSSENILNIDQNEVLELRKRGTRFLKKFEKDEIYNDSKSPFFKNLKYLKEEISRLPERKYCNLIILTNKMSQKNFSHHDENISGFIVKTELVDIRRLSNIANDINNNESIDVSFIKLDNSRKVKCIMIESDKKGIESFLAVIPGKIIYQMYLQYGKTMFESNVRSYLKDTTKINKGMKETISNDPQLFFSYNNGLSIIADDVKWTRKGSDFYITEIKNLQIVNGGQTASTIYFSYRDNFNKANISVPAKITKIQSKKESNQEVISKIAMYNNSQNNISIPDLYANHPYLIDFENVSKQFLNPNGDLWFFERKKGDFKLKELFVKKSKKAKLKLKQMNLKERMLDKTILALIDTMADGYPHIACQGATKCFSFFIEQFDGKSEKISEKEYKTYIAMTILFYTFEKHASKLNIPGGMQRYSCCYLLSNIKILKEINYKYIWKEQSVSEEFENKIDELLERVRNFIEDENPGELINTEWVKKESCWELFQKHKIISKSELNFQDFL